MSTPPPDRPEYDPLGSTPYPTSSDPYASAPTSDSTTAYPPSPDYHAPTAPAYPTYPPTDSASGGAPVPQYPPVNYPGPGYQTSSPGPYPAPTPDPASGMAIAALVFGLLGITGVCFWGLGGLLGLGGVICGHLAMSTIKKSGDGRSRGLARAGLVTGYISVAISVAAAIVMIALIAWSANNPSTPTDYDASAMSLLVLAASPA
ncbi:DUF4190 domain-containing protein [Janibacter sp. GXQ6167]|uniref:DUF4190 domain-containing protein n=1 Tax=Janibacter sp. GXQ6167 TaxID=3240791 RepID=UPI00352419FF